MRMLVVLAAAGTFLTSPVRAVDVASDVDGHEAALAALAAQATPPATLPALPGTASDQALSARARTAPGAKGEAEQLARGQAARTGSEAADAARAEAANRAAQGAAASAAKEANADAHSAAGQARAAAARAAHGKSGKNPGKGHEK